jgi:2-polyprenyl-6-methoxyphenol hydroxylase-like FAD-dependent oxidoreductase
MPRRALVIGGSIGGLFAAHLLRQAGWDVALFERSAGDLADRGAGLGVSSELFAVMRRIGITFDRSLSSYVKTSAWLRPDGSIGGEIDRGWHSSAWSIIYQPLRNAFPAALYRPGKTLERIEQDGTSVTAIFTDGTRERGDLLVAADGVFSTARRQYLPDLAPTSAGYVAWRGLIDEKDLPPNAEWLLPRSAFSLPEGEFAVSLAVPGPNNDLRPGHRRYYFIWYRPADADVQRDLFTDAAGKAHGLSIPPPLIRETHVAAMKTAAKHNLPPPLGEIVGRVAQPMLQSITDMEAPQLVFGRVALLGDSAFVARPHVAAGTTKAALDGAGLVDALAAQGGDIDAALKQYEKERTEFGRALISHARYLGAYLEAPPDARPSRDPEQILREYGAPHLVHNDEM